MIAKVGQSLPSSELGRVIDDQLKTVHIANLLRGRRVVIVGLPGAFTPLCTGLHLPELIAHAPKLRASGIDEIFCVAPNSPWVVYEWARKLDPYGAVTMLSDGNLDFAKATGLISTERSLFLGQCCKRFSMIVKDAVIEKLAVEDHVSALTCSRPALLLD